MTDKSRAGSPQRESVLDRIVAETRAALAATKRAQPEPFLRDLAVARPAPRDFGAALLEPGLGLVAEVKKGSPSKGPFAAGIDHVGVARAFRDAGAAAISVLTSPHFYADNLELDEVATALSADARDAGPPCPPLLCKEFHIDPYQVAEARALGADAYLLIVKTLEAAALRDLIHCGEELCMTAFVEVTDEAELEMALEAGAKTIGINNRDLHTFRDDLSTSERLRPRVPDGIPVVAASGMQTRADVERMRDAGVHAVMIGEALCVAPDPSAKIRELWGAVRPAAAEGGG